MMSDEAARSETEEEKLAREVKEKERELLEIQLRNAKAEEEERRLKKLKQQNLREQRPGIGWLIGWGIAWFFILGVLVLLIGIFALPIPFLLVWWAHKRMTQGE